MLCALWASGFVLYSLSGHRSFYSTFSKAAGHWKVRDRRLMTSLHGLCCDYSLPAMSHIYFCFETERGRCKVGVRQGRVDPC